MKKIITIGCFILFALPVTASSSGAQLRSSTVIAIIVESHEAGLAYAYESLFKTYEVWPKVKAVVEFTITADGSVKNVKARETEGFDTSSRGPVRAGMLADKITEAAYTWKFPPVSVGVVNVDMPFLFVPVEAEEKEIAESEKPLEEKRDYNGIRAENELRAELDVSGVYIFKEFIIECRRERAVPFGVARARPKGDVFTKAAQDKRLDGAAGKPMRDYLKEVASFLDELSKGPASKLRKKLASRGREMREVEAALADEESYVAVADLGPSKEYNWRIKKANAKKVARLREKRERLSLEIEKLANEFSTAAETWSRSVAEKRAALIARGEELRGNGPGAETDFRVLTALGELYLDEGDFAKAAAAFEKAVGKEATEGSAEPLYGLAHSYLGAGDEEKSARAFLRLAEEYPASRHAAEANFRLGEYFTSQLEPDKAEEHFLPASRSDGEYGDAALYRAAWGYYACSSPLGTAYYDRAVPAFKRFLDAAGEDSEFRKHAIKITALCLAEWEPGTAGRPAPLEALSRYEEVFAGAEERPYSADVLRALGDAYLYKMDKRPEAAATYEYLLEKYPSYDDAPTVAESLVETHLRREGYDDAHDARVRLVNGYGLDSSWYRAQDDLTRCQAIITWENALYEVAVYYNMRAERKYKTKPEESRGLYESAINRYNQYLTSFPTNEKAYHVNFYLAESYYSIKDYEAAAQQYIKTATRYTDRERYKIDKWDEKFNQEQALFNAIVARDEIFQEEVEGAAAPSEAEELPQEKLSRPLSAAEAELARVCNLYLERYRESREVPTILSKLGEVYFYAGDYDCAREAYERIIEDYVDAPDPERQKDHDQIYVNAAENVAKSYFNEAEFYEKAGAYKEARRRYELACEWYAKTKHLAESRGVRETIERAASLAGLTGLKAAEMRGAGVQLEEEGEARARVTRYDFVEIYPPLRPMKSSVVKAKRAEAKGYEAVAKEHGATCPDIGRLALGKAADTYYEARDWGNASRGYLNLVEFYESVDQFYVGTRNHREAYEKAAEGFERRADWAGAAEVYLEIACHPEFKSADFGRECLFRAGMMYEQLEDWAKAAETFARFTEEYPHEARPRLEATYRLARAQEKLGRESYALESHEEVVAIFKYAEFKGLDIAGTEKFVAESEFKVTDAKFDEYEAVRFVMPREVMEANLQKKIKQSQDLVAYYTDVAALGIPKWSVAARCRLGDVFYEFAEALRGAEIPTQLLPEYWEALPEDDERKPLLEDAHYEYTSELEEQVVPLYKKAAEEYKEAVAIAEAEGLETTWSRKARERLSALEAVE